MVTHIRTGILVKKIQKFFLHAQYIHYLFYMIIFILNSIFTDERWRELRPTVSPAFTSSKMKMMFGLIEQCSRQFVEHFAKKNQDTIELDLDDNLSRLTNDVIATTSFGLQCDSLKERNNKFYLMGKELTNLRLFVFFLQHISPKLAKVNYIT